MWFESTKGVGRGEMVGVGGSGGKMGESSFRRSSGNIKRQGVDG